MHAARIAAMCAGAAILALCLESCGPDKVNCPPNAPCPTATPNSSTCTNFSGSRNVLWHDNCGRSGTGTMTIVQVSCTFQASLAGLGTFNGTVAGNSLTFSLAFTDPCAGTATGSGTVSGATIALMYSGTQTGGATCCSPVTGTVTVDFAPTPVPTTPTPTPLPG